MGVARIAKMVLGLRYYAPVLLTLLCACAPRTAKLPLDQLGEPYISRLSLIEEVVPHCMATIGATGRLDIAGVTAGQRVRARLMFGVWSGAAMRLETRDGSSKQPFQFSADAEEGTLYLPQANTVIHEPASEILKVIFGLPMMTHTWQRLLLQCPPGGGGDIERMPSGWLRAGFGGADEFAFAYFKPLSDGKWSMVALLGRQKGSGTGWRADLHGRQSDGWRTVRLTAVDWSGEEQGDYVVLRIDPTHINPPLDLSHVSVAVPPTARAVTLDELRGSRLLAASNSR